MLQMCFKQIDKLIGMNEHIRKCVGCDTSSLCVKNSTILSIVRCMCRAVCWRCWWLFRMLSDEKDDRCSTTWPPLEPKQKNAKEPETIVEEYLELFICHAEFTFKIGSSSICNYTRCNVWNLILVFFCRPSYDRFLALPAVLLWMRLPVSMSLSLSEMVTLQWSQCEWP